MSQEQHSQTGPLTEKTDFMATDVRRGNDAAVEHAAQDEMLADIDRELDDDPNLTIDQLTPEEQSRIHVIVWGVEHTPQYMHAITASMVPMDYCLTEHVPESDSGSPPPDKLKMDRNANFEARSRQQNGETAVDDVYTQSMLISCPANAALRQNWPVPVLRRIDVDAHEPSGEPWYDTQEQHLDAAMRLGYEVGKNLLLENSNDLRALIEEYVEVRATSSAYREQVQLDQISVIAANAVRRHPEKDQIVIGIIVGAAHSAILETLIEDTHLRFEPVKYVPEYKGRLMGTGLDGLVRARSFGEVPSIERINRELLSMIVYSAFEWIAFSRSEEIAITMSDFFANEDNCSDEEVQQLLQEIDAIKQRAYNEMGSEGEQKGQVKFETTERIEQLGQTDTRLAGLLDECRAISSRPRTSWALPQN